MGKVSAKVRYYVVRNGNGFWQPGKHARKLGFYCVACGTDGPSAWAKAEEWNKKLDDCRKNGEPLPPYQDGTLSHWFHTWVTLDDFKAKKPATRTEYHTAWRHIDPEFGDQQIDHIKPAHITKFHKRLDVETSERVRWGTIRLLRAILLAAERHEVLQKAPALLLTNSMPAPREALWFPQEIEALRACAVEKGMLSLSIAISLLYETALSPADIRTLSMNMIASDESGAYIQRKRTKTSKTAAMPISRGLFDTIATYVEKLPFELAMDAPILRRHNTQKPWKDAPDFAKDFRRVREIVFPGDKRQARDVRRTVSFEADLGGADANERGDLLANSMGGNRKLEETYTPSNVIRARKTQAKRKKGQEIMRQIGTKQAPKV